MNFQDPAPLSLPTLILNLILGLMMSLIVSVFYIRYGKSLSNRRKFAEILPVLTLITLLVISIVKSSLALSLGLVGALSIVRFRTAIKDPEELIFLFFALSIGLGMGADQRVPTIVAVCLILIYLFVGNLIRKQTLKSYGSNLFVNIHLKTELPKKEIVDFVNEQMLQHFAQVDLHRMDLGEEELSLVYYFQSTSPENTMSFSSQVQSQYPTVNITIVDQNNLLQM